MIVFSQTLFLITSPNSCLPSLLLYHTPPHIYFHKDSQFYFAVLMNLELVLLSTGWHLNPLKNKERGNIKGKRIREWSRWQSGSTWSSPSPRNISKIHLYVERSSQNICWTLEGDLRLLKNQENLHVTGYEKTLKKKKGVGSEAVPLRESCERGKVPVPREAPSPSRRVVGTEGEPLSLRGEHGSLFVAATADG